MNLVYCSVLSIVYGILMIFPFLVGAIVGVIVGVVGGVLLGAWKAKR